MTGLRVPFTLHGGKRKSARALPGMALAAGPMLCRLGCMTRGAAGCQSVMSGMKIA